MSSLLIIWCYLFSNVLMTTPYKIHPTIQLVREAGFPAEEHRIVTDDGYWIVLHRLPNLATRVRPKVVIYIHGLFAGSLDLVIRGRETGLAFEMFEEGFDVWLPNLRGTADGPVTVEPNKNDTWDFSWDENAQYDFPAIMDYVLYVTNAEKVSLMGMSMAANVVLGGIALQPKYNHNINGVVFFAPTIYLKHVSSFIGQAAPHWQKLQELTKLTGVTWLPFINTDLFHRIMSWICSLQYIGVFICASVIFTAENIVFNIEKDLVTRIFKYYPHPGSTKSIIHYLQIMDSGRFCAFDYGEEENIRRYNSILPREYNLSEVRVPAGIFYSYSDTFVNLRDAERLISELNTTLAYAVTRDKFAHLSFMWDPDIKTTVHNRVIDFLSSL